MKMVVLLVCFFYGSFVLALEIDEKLPVRILKVSQTRKTLLTNRGLEDGLVVGDHAKFFMTTGVVARGVVVKASPTRSVWSMYRVVDGEQIDVDKVMNVKISEPLKITDDPTKMLSSESFPEFPPGEALSETASPQLSVDEKKDLQTLGTGNYSMNQMVSSKLTNRNWEVWGLFHLNSLSTSTSGGGVDSQSGKQSSFDFSIGIEKYFNRPDRWFGNISISPFFHKASHEASFVEGKSISTDVLEYGVGVFYHFINNPYNANQFLPFANITFGLGNSSESISFSDATQTDNEFDGSVSFFSLGIGTKYYSAHGFGFRVLLDYYNRNESYEIEGSTEALENKVAGPRLLVGLAYRF